MFDLFSTDIGEYQPWLVGLSIALAMMTCYVAIEVLGRIHTAREKRRWAWQVLGSVVLSSGLLSVHVVGLLALQFPFDAGLDPIGLLQAWVLMEAAAAISYMVASADRLTWLRWIGGAMVMSGCAVGMIWRGVLAMGIEPLPVFDGYALAATFCIGWAGATIGFWVAFNIRGLPQLQALPARVVTAIGLGLAVASMHYLLIAGVSLEPDAQSNVPLIFGRTWLALLIAAASVFFFMTTSLAVVLDRRLDEQTASLIASLQAANLKLGHSSRHDNLTGLPNRQAAGELVAAAIERCNVESLDCGVIYIDFDGFKLINDTLGHSVGDQFLARASELLVAIGDSHATAARIGGDEFLLVIENLDDARIADICARVTTVFSELGDQGMHVTASMGSARYPADAQTAPALIAAADMAMYAAKRAGRNQHVVYTPCMGAATLDRFTLQEELRQGIARHELEMHYQPKYRTLDQQITGAEALVRWQHPTRGLLAPGIFITIAEQGGLIKDLEQEVFECVCRQIRSWQDAGYRVPPISVNLSAARVFDPDLEEDMLHTLARYGVHPEQLVLEITETLVMQELGRAREVLSRLAASGLQIALDDFGTGYSSLSYLRQLPIQQLKIDRSFIADLNHDNPGHEEIVRTIVHLAHVLELHVVAEGIEAPHQLDSLRAMGCDEIQGFLLSRPLPADAFEKALTV